MNRLVRALAASAALIVLCLGLAGALAPVFQGTLGGQAIVLDAGNGGVCTARGSTDDFYASCYFFKRDGVDILLKRRDVGGQVVFTELPSKSARPLGVLTLRHLGARLSGRWRSLDGRRTLPVELTQVDTADVKLVIPSSPDIELLQETPQLYELLKLNHPFQMLPPRDNLNWLREPYTGITFPRVPGDGPAASRINESIQDLQLDLVEQQLRCLPLSNEDLAGLRGVITRVYRPTSRLLSLNYRMPGDACFVPFSQGLAFDLSTGRELILEALWPGLTQDDQDQRYVASYRRQGGSAACLKRLEGARQPNQKASGLKESGNYDWALTPRGLTLDPQFLADNPCRRVVTLPYASLDKLAGPLAPR